MIEGEADHGGGDAAAAVGFGDVDVGEPGEADGVGDDAGVADLFFVSVVDAHGEGGLYGAAFGEVGGEAVLPPVGGGEPLMDAGEVEAGLSVVDFVLEVAGAHSLSLTGSGARSRGAPGP